MLPVRWGGSVFYKNYENFSRSKYLVIILQQVLRMNKWQVTNNKYKWQMKIILIGTTLQLNRMKTNA